MCWAAYRMINFHMASRKAQHFLILTRTTTNPEQIALLMILIYYLIVTTHIDPGFDGGKVIFSDRFRKWRLIRIVPKFSAVLFFFGMT